MSLRSELILVVEPVVSRFAQDDPRGRRDRHELRDQLGDLITPRPAPAGTKGAVESAEMLIVALGSVNALRHAVQAFQVWARRDLGREVRVKGADARGNPMELSLKGMSEDAALQAIRQVFGPLGGD